MVTSNTQNGWRDLARVLLAGIRLFNGAVALVAPGILVSRLGSDPDTDPVAKYAFRMFGIRTVLVGAALLWPDEQVRRRAVRQAPLIHASDTIAALLTSRSARVPAGAGKTIVAISGVNTILSLLMQPGKEG